MFSTLFTSKRKPTSIKNSKVNNNKTSHNLLDVLLAELGINSTNRVLTNDPHLKEEKSADGFKDTVAPTNELQKIELNQLAYSKLMAKKLQKAKFGKNKGKSILLHS